MRGRTRKMNGYGGAVSAPGPGRRALSLGLSLLCGLPTACTPEPPDAREIERQFSGHEPYHASVEGMSGRPDRGLHPPIDDPEYIEVERADRFLEDDDIVFVIPREHETLVYPELILGVHHVVNTVLDDRPVAITHCMLADSAILYSRGPPGASFRLAALGTFYLGNLVMYDVATGSYWLQLRGEAFHGPRRGDRLENLGAIERTTWDAVKQLHSVRVLAPRAAVVDYREFLDNIRASTLGLDVLRKSTAPDIRLPPYTPGLGVEVHGEACFFPVTAIEERGLLQVAVGGWSLLLVFDDRTQTSRMFRRRLDGRVLSFRRSSDGLMDTTTGSRWTLEGECVDGELAGTALERPVYTRAYWYAWAEFYRGSAIGSD